MKYSKLLSAAALICGLAMPTITLANSLFITNNTNENSTSTTNGALGFCSDRILGSAGVTKAHEQNHEITSFQLNMACKPHTEDCISKVYMQTGCKGPEIAEVEFSLTTGIKSIKAFSPKYKMSGNGFIAQIDYAS